MIARKVSCLSPNLEMLFTMSFINSSEPAKPLPSISSFDAGDSRSSNEAIQIASSASLLKLAMSDAFVILKPPLFAIF